VRVEARQFNGSGGIDEVDTGVFLNLPWPWHGKYGAMAAEAEASRRMAEAELAEEKNATLLEVRDLYAHAESARLNMLAYQEAILPRARQLVESAGAAYAAGGASYLELTEAEQALRAAELGYFRTKAEYGKKVAALESIAAPWDADETASRLAGAKESP
jgi:outer membrane protein TolC